MVLLEGVGSIPEAMVIAEATAEGRMSIVFAFSIFTLNLANTMATALDFLATHPEKKLHRVLVCLIFFSVGSLSYSISSTVFSSFLTNLAEGIYTFWHLFPMLLGVVLGALLIYGLLYLEERTHRKALDTASSQGNVQDAAVARDQEDVLEPIRLSLEREKLHLEAAMDADYDNQEYRETVIKHYSERVTKIKDLIASFESAHTLQGALKLPITQDAADVVEDSLRGELGAMEHTYLLQPKRGRNNSGESLNRRALNLLIIMTLLLALSVALTFAFTPLFLFLDEADGSYSSYLNAFAEGLSGGSFLATISSTMIPRIQQDAYRSHWDVFTIRVAGMLSFCFGMVFSVHNDSRFAFFFFVSRSV